MKILLSFPIFLILIFSFENPSKSQSRSLQQLNPYKQYNFIITDEVKNDAWSKKPVCYLPAQSLKYNHQAKTMAYLSENNPFENPDSIIAQQYNADSNKWENSFRVISNFDLDNNAILKYSYYWNDTLDQWYYVYRDYIEYNLNNKLIHSDYSNWNIESSQWIFEHKSEVTHTDSLVTSLGYNWKNNEWELSSKSEFVYNDNQLNTEETGYLFCQSDSSWKYNYKNFIEYDSSGNQTKDSTIVCDTLLDSCVPSYKREHLYNTEGNLSGRIFYWPDQFTGILSAGSKYNIYYDELERQTDCLYYSRGESSSDWILDSKSKWSYYGDTLIFSVDSSLIGGKWYPTRGIDSYKRRGYYLYVHYNFNGVEKAPYYRFFEYNSGVINNESSLENKSNKITIYPNPASDILYFSTEDKNNGINISLIDLQGRIVLQKDIGEGSSLTIKNVPKGLYIYRIAVKDNIVTGKIIIE